MEIMIPWMSIRHSVKYIFTVSLADEKNLGSEFAASVYVVPQGATEIDFKAISFPKIWHIKTRTPLAQSSEAANPNV